MKTTHHRGITERRIPRRAKEKVERWDLRLYVAGQNPRAVTAFENLKVICDERLKGKYHIEVMDLLKNPRLARDNQVFALPTLVRRLPLPVRKIIGDLSNTARVLVGLDLTEHVAAGSPAKV